MCTQTVTHYICPCVQTVYPIQCCNLRRPCTFGWVIDQHTNNPCTQHAYAKRLRLNSSLALWCMGTAVPIPMNNLFAHMAGRSYSEKNQRELDWRPASIWGTWRENDGGASAAGDYVADTVRRAALRDGRYGVDTTIPGLRPHEHVDRWEEDWDEVDEDEYQD
ncbi:hypothetical protein HDV00_012286 [Rhizophlyctis rosea]|nr:hypothetical protein HDV00_012286 [Rhizophlyctis rosea]